MNGYDDGDELPEDSNVVHYVSSSRIADDTVTWEAFRKKRPGKNPSVHWLEQFGGTKLHQLACVRARSTITLRPSGKFAELRVGDIVAECRDKLGPSCQGLTVVYRPLPTDPSHSDIEGIPEREEQCERVLCEILASCVADTLHDAVSRD